jgi:hypothetical protein
MLKSNTGPNAERCGTLFNIALKVMNHQADYINSVLGNDAFINELGSTAIEAGPKQGTCLCHLCGQEVPVKKMLHHVGHHVIAYKMDLKEDLQQQVSGFLQSIQIFLF